VSQILNIWTIRYAVVGGVCVSVTLYLATVVVTLPRAIRFFDKRLRSESAIVFVVDLTGEIEEMKMVELATQAQS